MSVPPVSPQPAATLPQIAGVAGVADVADVADPKPLRHTALPNDASSPLNAPNKSSDTAIDNAPDNPSNLGRSLANSSVASAAGSVASASSPSTSAAPVTPMPSLPPSAFSTVPNRGHRSTQLRGGAQLATATSTPASTVSAPAKATATATASAASLVGAEDAAGAAGATNAHAAAPEKRDRRGLSSAGPRESAQPALQAAQAVQAVQAAQTVPTAATTRFGALWGRLRRLKGVIAAIAGVGAVLGGLVGYYNTFQIVNRVVATGAPEAVSQPASPKGTVPVNRPRSALTVAVLPFANLTGDPNQAYLADGLTASVTGDLSRLKEAIVIPAATAFTYRDKAITLPQLSKELDVRFVLQGNVQRHGEKIRINAQLADAPGNVQLWAESFEGDLSNLFALQDQVTARMGTTVGQQMVVLAARESESRKGSPMAADLKLRARALSLKPQSLANWKAIEALYRQAIKADATDTNAVVGLAWALTMQAANFNDRTNPVAIKTLFNEAHALVRQVKPLDVNNPLIYFVEQVEAGNSGDFQGAQIAAEMRLKLDPRNASAHTALGNHFLSSGEPVRALAFYQSGLALTPNQSSGYVFILMAKANFMLGDDEQTIVWMRRASDIDPLLSSRYAPFLAMAYARAGQSQQTAQVVQSYLAANPKSSLTTFNPADEKDPVAYKTWREQKLIPAWTLAGLPL